MTGQQEKAMKSKEYKKKYGDDSLLDRIKNQINDFSNVTTTYSGMGGHQMKDSDRFSNRFDVKDEVKEENQDDNA